jgi:hypothetical protein
MEIVKDFGLDFVKLEANGVAVLIYDTVEIIEPPLFLW